MPSEVQPQGPGLLVPGKGSEIVALLESRHGLLTEVVLKGGKRVRFRSVAWGRDMGDDWEHVNLFVSVDPPPSRDDQFCSTSEIVEVLDPASRERLFPTSKPEP